MSPFPIPPESGLLVGGMAGYGLGMLRGWWSQAQTWLMAQASCTVEIRSGDVLFEAALRWLQAQQEHRGKWRNVTALYQAGEEAPRAVGEMETEGELIISPANGIHLLHFQGRLVWLERQRHDTKEGHYWRETMVLRILARNPDILEELLRAILRYRSSVNRDEVAVYSNNSFLNHWGCLQRRMVRSRDSVILPEGIMADLLADGEWFLGASGRYRELGIPWRRGYLFHGPPGTGKSSTVMAVASALQLPIYILTLSNRKSDDSDLFRLINDIPARSVLLLEDADSLVPEREEKQGEGITFSGLINALDGVAAKEGLLICMTTNYRERLDPALIRPGRIDRQLAFGPATPEQARTLYRRFYPAGDGPDEGSQAADLADGVRTMADLQERFWQRYDLRPDPVLLLPEATPVKPSG